MINNKPPETDCIMAVAAGGLFLFLQFCQTSPMRNSNANFNFSAAHHETATMKNEEYREWMILSFRCTLGEYEGLKSDAAPILPADMRASLTNSFCLSLRTIFLSSLWSRLDANL